MSLPPRIESLIAIDLWMTSCPRERLWRGICVPGDAQQQQGSVSVTVIRNLIRRGSRENRVSPLSDTSVKRRDISSGHVFRQLNTATRLQRSAHEQRARYHSHVFTRGTSHNFFRAPETHKRCHTSHRENCGYGIVFAHISDSFTPLVRAENEYGEFRNK